MAGWRYLACCFFVVFNTKYEKSLASDYFTNEVSEKLIFPANFIFGVTSLSYQINVDCNRSGQGETTWDRHTANYPRDLDGTNAPKDCDSNQNYKDDVKRIKTIGFGLYRFPLSWSWILPNGTTDLINAEGLRYYKNLIDELLANDIEPMVILFHRDVPRPLQDIGGWLNPLTTRHFVNYARLIFQQLGPKVKWWITINEPTEITEGYGRNKRAPALNLHGYGEYLAGHNLLRAHSEVYRLYKAEFATNQGGKVSIGLKVDFIFQASDSEEDIRAAYTAMQFSVGWFGHPIYSPMGDYPPVMRDYIDRNSAIEGLKQSRLPYFNRTEQQQIKGSFDFLAVNHYTSKVASFSQSGPQPSWQRDSGVKLFFREDWPSSGCPHLKVVPEGFRKVLNYLKEEYGNIEIFVTENGYCDTGELQDVQRVIYYNEYLSQMLKAIKEDACNITGYCVRSLMDGSFEWENGFIEKYGLYQTNDSNPSNRRMKKLSANFWTRLLTLNKP